MNLEYTDYAEGYKGIEFDYQGQEPLISEIIKFLKEAQDKGYTHTNLDLDGLDCYRKLTPKEINDHEIERNKKEIERLQEKINKLKEEING